MYLDFQNAYSGEAYLPDEPQLQVWIEAALSAAKASLEAEVTMRVVDIAEIQQLNRDFRNKDKPTNVLSFPSEVPDFLPEELAHSVLADDLGLDQFIGDIVIAADIVAEEAASQMKTTEAHWAHLTVHGTLHLLGFDHIEEKEADQMEALETEILVTMGYAPPYKE